MQRFSEGSFRTLVMVALLSQCNKLDSFQSFMQSTKKPNISWTRENQDEADDMHNKSKPYVRDGRFINRLVKEYCGNGLYVIDAFIGGISIREGLALRRRCLAMVFKETEKSTTETLCMSMIDSDHTLVDWA